MVDSITKAIKSPKIKVWLGLVISSAFIALALFLSAGTINYWQAWIYLGVGAVSGVPSRFTPCGVAAVLANAAGSAEAEAAEVRWHLVPGVF